MYRHVYVKPHPDVQTWLSLLNCLSLAVWRDVKDLIQNMTWKTAPKAENMSGFCDLAYGLIKEAIHLVCEKIFENRDMESCVKLRVHIANIFKHVCFGCRSNQTGHHVICASRDDELPQAPNTIISHVKLTQAIKACHGSKKGMCIFSPNGLNLGAGVCSTAMRMLVSRFRQCVQEAEVHRVVQSKVSLKTSR